MLRICTYVIIEWLHIFPNNSQSMSFYKDVMIAILVSVFTFNLFFTELSNRFHDHHRVVVTVICPVRQPTTKILLIRTLGNAFCQEH